MKKFRFGVQINQAASAAEWVRLAQQAEALGYDVLTMADHFNDQFAPVPALAVAAAVTTRLRLGALVFCNDFKHPVVLAKELATLDVLSGGRVEIGLGAGWLKTDYDTTGIAYDEPRVRLDRMQESVRIMRALFSDEPVEFEGKHYTLRGLNGMPKPSQRPHPPFYIGGGGQRMLSIAAREADTVGINVDLRSGDFDASTLQNASVESTLQKLQWIRTAAGDRFDDIELAILVYRTAVTADKAAVSKEVGEQFGLSPEALATVPNILIGTVEELVDTIQKRRQQFGFSYWTVRVDAMTEFAPIVKRLAGR